MQPIKIGLKLLTISGRLQALQMAEQQGLYRAGITLTQPAG